MFEKFAQSWELVKASAGVLKSDKELLVFPALSAVCALVVAAGFFLPVAVMGGMFEQVSRHQMSPGLMLLSFAFYLVQYFVIIFFNSALVGAALIRLRGGDPTVADGFRIAMSKLPIILGYAVIAATVGALLRAVEERAGFVGRWVTGLIGLVWTLATFLAVPVLVNLDVGPIEAVKRSAELMKKTWGQNLIGNVGIGLVFGLMMFGVIALGVLAIVGVAATKSAVLIGTVAALLVIVVLLLALVQAALQGIYSAALYRYAEEGEIGGGFDQAMVANAFRVKA